MQTKQIRQWCVPEIKDVDESKRKVTHLISTAALDRGGDIVNVDGWDLRNYRKNPVVLVDHDYRVEKIIGAGKVTSDKQGLWAVTEFADTELAETAFNLHTNGFARAWSVGFSPIKGHPVRDGKEHECDTCSGVKQPGYGMHFLKQELLEYSLVSVPMNPEAVTQAVERGICSKALAPVFFRELDGEPTTAPVETAPPEAKAADVALSDEARALLERVSGQCERNRREAATLRYLLRD